MSLIHELTNIGLSDKEAKVYLAALELSQASVQDIAKKSAVNRATTYVILDSLIQSGLVSTFAKAKKTFYVAESPEMIVSILEVQKKEIDEKQKHIKGLIPQLKSIYNRQENKPVVRFFEGKKGLLSMVEEQMASKDNLIRFIYSVDDVKRIFTDKERDLVYEDRIQKNSKSKAIYNFKKGVLPTKTKYDDRVKVDEKKYPMKSDIALFDNKVRLASLGKKLNGVIIEDEDIYQTLVSLFDLAWEAANRENKNSR